MGKKKEGKMKKLSRVLLLQKTGKIHRSLSYSFRLRLEQDFDRKLCLVFFFNVLR